MTSFGLLPDDVLSDNPTVYSFLLGQRPGEGDVLGPLTIRAIMVLPIVFICIDFWHLCNMISHFRLPVVSNRYNIAIDSENYDGRLCYLLTLTSCLST